MSGIYEIGSFQSVNGLELILLSLLPFEKKKEAIGSPNWKQKKKMGKKVERAVLFE